ncbi:sensor histidine kinase [Streptomyces sp. PKU-MA01144]|uniref:sensor histidine kinase n=1 Tax=Streptomyces TaxID=1883 RepID=UPI00147C8FA5|nr:MULTISPECIES: sensor histidine kinase [Streptomyces]MCY0983589.1 sensor histidine kinase [Streptomyces tirandamycinicus]NNJ08209.1 sensor histidine kinase [Streptomyces sp. PKU-MA01144]
MTLPTPYRVAAGLIYLSVGSLVGLLLAPLVVASLALRAASWLLLAGLPAAVVAAVRGAAAVARWGVPARRRRTPRPAGALTEVLRQVPARMAALRDGMSFSLPLLRAVADLERLLAHSVVGDPGDPAHRSAAAEREAEREREHRSAEASWDDIGYLGLLLFGTVWLLPLAALAVPVVAFVVALPLGPPEQLAFGPGLTLPVTGPATRVSVAAASVALFSALLGLLFWMGKLRARLVRRILSRIDEAEAQRREEAAERQRIAALRVNDADYRRLERDLHDGAQARLAVLLMHLSHARHRRKDDAEYLSALIDETHQEIGKALDEIRDLVHGIQPPILSDRGLDAAVTALTERFHVPVVVSSGLERRPDVSVESTAYYIVAECLANTVKHASATRIHVRLEEYDNQLVVAVTDDGTGGASLTAGTGLRGLEDRAAALNGRLDISSPPGGPTTVTATLPWSVNPI